MALINYADSALSLLPPIAAVTLAIMTRKVLLSLGVGILLGIALLVNWSPSLIIEQISSRAIALVWDGEGLAKWNIYTIGFLITMGILMALISISGGTSAFAKWAKARIKNQRDAQLSTLFLGAIIFIDDYFNALLVGNVSRPITDQYKISREKLAYCIDSTSAPVCVISPISTWGAYIMSILATLVATHGLTEYTPLSLFVQMIPYNLYAISALVLLFCVVCFKMDFGPMASAEERAQNGKLWDEEKGTPPGEDLGLEEATQGKISNLVMPILLLISLVIGLMLFSGNQALMEANKGFDLIGALENSSGSWSMVTAGAITIVVTLITMLFQGIAMSQILKASVMGIRSMLPAVYILVMAWSIASVIGDIQTGKYLASLASGSIPAQMIPALILLISAAAAFSTGTSYGTFAIMMPIAANLAMVLDPALLLPSMAAALAGGVFGDHCSPISDTTILSSTGSGCHHIDHVSTQLPYALLAGVIALVGYLVLGFTDSVGISLIFCLAVIASITFFFRQRKGTMTMA